MNFLYPLGLLGLLGIPILIIIYIIKNKYTEQTVASTYLWVLSERFLRRKNPLSRLAGIISLILQIALVALISLAIAHPIITVPGAAREYCFILDASGSMTTEYEEKTRFDEAKDRINAIMGEATDGSCFTLITVSDTTTVVFERAEDKARAAMIISELQPKHTDADFSESLSRAQRYFNENSGLKAYLFTDKSYASEKNIEVVDLSRAEENYAVSSVKADVSGSKINILMTVISYESDAELDILMVIDGKEELTFKETAKVKAGESLELSYSYPVSDFGELKVTIENEDHLPLDNTYVLLDTDFVNSYKTLIVSETPYFIEKALVAGSSADVTVVSPENYTETLGKGYGLYIFQNYSPSVMPTDGSVWFINPTDNVANSGFSLQGEIESDSSEGVELSLTTSTNSIAKRLTQYVSGKGIFVKKYVKLGLYSNFTTLLSYKGTPMVFTGVNGYGNREVVFSFDIQASNLTIHPDFVFLLNNLIEYSFPDVIEETEYTVEDTVVVNSVSNCESIRVEAPSGNAVYLDLTSAIATFIPTEAGVHKIILTVDGDEREYEIFAALSESERDPVASEESIAIEGEPSSKGLDGIYDALIVVVVLMALIYIVDWGVYCYDKYRLR